MAELGYDTLLMPDGLQLLSPFPSLAVAAMVTDLRVGTFVLAAPLRPPRLAAWEAHSMSVLTEGRFELGIGTGRPAARQFAQQLGLHYGSAAERLAQLDQTIDHLRELDAGSSAAVQPCSRRSGPARSGAGLTAHSQQSANGVLVP